MIEITNAAVVHLKDLLESKNASPETGLRLQIEKGGCAGLQYAMRLDTSSEGDQVITKDDVAVIIDAESASFLRGCTLDYVEALNDSGFRVENPNAERSCGCGTSFEPKKNG